LKATAEAIAVGVGIAHPVRRRSLIIASITAGFLILAIYANTHQAALYGLVRTLLQLAPGK
jgi:hypothetical protein